MADLLLLKATLEGAKSHWHLLRGKSVHLSSSTASCQPCRQAPPLALRGDRNCVAGDQELVGDSQAPANQVSTLACCPYSAATVSDFQPADPLWDDFVTLTSCSTSTRAWRVVNATFSYLASCLQGSHDSSGAGLHASRPSQLSTQQGRPVGSAQNPHSGCCQAFFLHASC